MDKLTEKESEALEDVVARQEWRTFDGEGFLFGDQLARRFVRKGFRGDVPATFAEFSRFGVGDTVTGGTSSWTRIR